jgi:hypothetical protein
MGAGAFQAAAPGGHGVMSKNVRILLEMLALKARGQTAENPRETNKQKTHSGQKLDDVALIKEMLEEEKALPRNAESGLKVSPVTHNEGRIFLQFCGWSINLYEDGTWDWEDTTG